MGISPDRAFDAPITFKVDGKEYKMKRLGVEGMSLIYQRIRDNRLASIIRMRNQLRPHEMGVALGISTKNDPTEADYHDYLATPEGLVYSVTLCLREHHPRITEKEVAAMMEHEDGMSVGELLMQESGMVEPTPDEDPEVTEKNNPFPVFQGNSAGEKSTGGK